MYRVIIEFKRSLNHNQIKELTATAVKNFDNRAGRVQNTSTDPYTLLFEGDSEGEFECLDLGNGILAGSDFIHYADKWDWIDTEDDFENTDILQLYGER